MGTNYSIKVVVAACAVVAVVAFIGGYYAGKDASSSDDAQVSVSPSPSETVSPSPTAAYKPKAYTIKLTGQGVTPASLSIRVGDSVTLLNQTYTAFWPASDPHPSHTDCPGFDALRGLNYGESYTLTFTRVEVCGYHNHLDAANAAMRGTITVR